MFDGDRSGDIPYCFRDLGVEGEQLSWPRLPECDGEIM